MSREEAIRRLGGILTEAVEFENSVCYVTEEDAEPLEMAIKALEQEPCEDCISRKDAINAMSNALERVFLEHRAIAERTMNKLPPVTPQPKVGHWISHYDENTKEGWYECDRCHTERAFNTDYCPDCGAKMQEVEE